MNAPQIHTVPGALDLLPYVEPAGSGFKLAFSIDKQSVKDPGVYSFPFVTLGADTAFYRLVKARVTSEAGNPVKAVHVLLQHDDSPMAADDSPFGHNRDIERSWQSTFRHYAAAEDPASKLILPAHPESGGETLMPFQSLFYCTREHRYFPPLCPHCGCHLDLCRDERTLKDAGLSSYINSLRRYLFCPECHLKTGKTTFYVPHKIEADPPSVEDRRDLIIDFSRLLTQAKPGIRFPCLDCALKTECYLKSHLAGDRIRAFSFFPFYMLVFNSEFISMREYLPLVAGAALKRGQKGASQHVPGGGILDAGSRADTPITTPSHYFENDPDLFLEILLLKLSFLDVATRRLFADPRLIPADWQHLGTDSIVLSAPTAPSHTPISWTFSPSIIGLWQPAPHAFDQATYDPTAYGHRSSPSAASDPGTSQAGGLPRSSCLKSMGLLWVATLVSNADQSSSDVCSTLERLRQKDGGSDLPLAELIAANGTASLFSAQNNFWNPISFTVDRYGQDLWRQSLSVGFSLMQKGKAYLDSRYRTDIRALKKNLWDRLFSGGARVAGSEADPRENDALVAILDRLSEKWRGNRISGKEQNDHFPQMGRADHFPGERQDLGRSNDISRQPPANEPGFAPQATVVQSSVPTPAQVSATPAPGRDVDLQETVLIRGQSPPSTHQPASSEPAVSQPAVSQPAVNQPAVNQPPGRPAAEQKKQALAETIISPDSGFSLGMNEPGARTLNSEPFKFGRSEQPKPGEKPRPDHPPAGKRPVQDPDLAETIIVPTNKDKDAE